MKLERRLQQDLNNVLLQEESLWLQKSRVNWLRAGDKNMQFFHTSTLVRRHRNRIEALENEEEGWISDQQLLRDMAVSYYVSPFSSHQGVLGMFMRGHFPRLSIDKLTLLQRSCEDEEVTRDLKEMSPLKAPGPDGFQACFYQRTWEMTGPRIIELVKGIMASGQLPLGLAEVLLVLVPKTDVPSSLAQYRPISLYNVLYKIVTKLITNCLKDVWGDLIGAPQASFIQGRQDTDNILICQELIHSIQKKSGGRGAMIIKLDLEKAYDKLGWPFIEDTLVDAGLPRTLINLIMHCISGGTCRLLWNKELTEPFQPSRGLRQGDLLSSYLFVLCMERLAQWITAQHQSGRWRPIKASCSGPAFTHLIFADDVLLFAEAVEDQILLIKQGLQLFCQTSSQSVSFSKSHVFFSPNVAMERKYSLSQLLGIPLTEDLGIYLGCPLLHKGKSNILSRRLLERARNKVAGWKFQCLSKAGRLTLASSVLSSIPVYQMQPLRMPDHICNELDRISRSCLWGEEGSRRKVHSVGWDMVCKPKPNVGLGLRKFRDFNKALLAKILWRMHSEAGSLWA